ncbi:hypothetical protein GIB67_028282 [Kingdonia uniflora]|uniref:RING-type domain-containing protein n=1 Tax=Kingdonia uniflora TaxID=39325 RepID=A0A7J7KZA9_9MAGN|nr:hypothetical protein GIB67_028282 [Kingdonia uniflora]
MVVLIVLLSQVRTYSEWVIDGEYDWPPACSLCHTVLEDGSDMQATRLGCLDVLHTSCLVSHLQSFPPHTAPAGYTCPSCSTSIWPPKSIKDSGSRLWSRLKEVIMQNRSKDGCYARSIEGLTSSDGDGRFADAIEDEPKEEGKTVTIEQSSMNGVVQPLPQSMRRFSSLRKPENGEEILGTSQIGVTGVNTSAFKIIKVVSYGLGKPEYAVEKFGLTQFRGGESGEKELESRLHQTKAQASPARTASPGPAQHKTSPSLYKLQLLTSATGDDTHSGHYDNGTNNYSGDFQYPRNEWDINRVREGLGKPIRVEFCNLSLLIDWDKPLIFDKSPEEVISFKFVDMFWDEFEDRPSQSFNQYWGSLDEVKHGGERFANAIEDEPEEEGYTGLEVVGAPRNGITNHGLSHDLQMRGTRQGRPTIPTDVLAGIAKDGEKTFVDCTTTPLVDWDKPPIFDESPEEAKSVGTKNTVDGFAIVQFSWLPLQSLKFVVNFFQSRGEVIGYGSSAMVVPYVVGLSIN